MTSPKRRGRIQDNNDVGWSSLVARKAHNLEAVGSNPAPTTLQAEMLVV